MRTAVTEMAVLAWLCV